MIEIRSSWIVEDGYARPLGSDTQLRRYRCSKCGERGHSVRTCGDEGRKARQR